MAMMLIAIPTKKIISLLSSMRFAKKCFLNWAEKFSKEFFSVNNWPFLSFTDISISIFSGVFVDPLVENVIEPIFLRIITFVTSNWASCILVPLFVFVTKSSSRNSESDVKPLSLYERLYYQ